MRRGLPCPAHLSWSSRHQHCPSGTAAAATTTSSFSHPGAPLGEQAARPEPRHLWLEGQRPMTVSQRGWGQPGPTAG